ncbi:CapA family protein [Patescibacteria group bacterium]|nr:CapA family protein [Patescibacteria group bacterium]MBU1673954.1 CapA family protein [Patescibacteria group bacterium]MBU1963948.1 CapA family protein [Patescibacteria group bacterium]
MKKTIPVIIVAIVVITIPIIAFNVTRPQNLSSEDKGPRRVLLSWDGADDTYFKIQLFTKVGERLKTFYSDVSEKLVKKNHIKSNQSYFFRVKDVSEETGEWSDGQRFRTVPKKVRDISFTGLTNDSVSLAWDLKRDQGVKFYIRLLDQDRNLVAKKKIKKEEFTFTGINPDTKYFVKIQAIYNKRNKSRWSKALSFNTPSAPPPQVTTIFGGDVMLSRYVARASEARGNYSEPFVRIADELKQNDLAFINLEAPFARSGPYYVDDNAMSFRVDPRFMDGLNLAGIDMASLANNHIGNAGQDGIAFTKEHLVNNGIGYCLETWAIEEVNGTKFAFLCYAYDRNLDTNKLISDINSVKDQADVIIVSMHNGSEYTENISSSQSGFAHTAIDHGADMVIGHHPHVVQRMEEYNGKYIFYSLGNLIFDQDWSHETTLGAAIKVWWEGDQVKKIQFKPVKIDYDFQPRWMDFEEGKEVLGRLRVDNYEIIK